MSISHGKSVLLKRFLVLFLTFIALMVWVLSPALVRADVASGYQEYYIPGATDQMWAIFDDLNPDPPMATAGGMHEVIGVTATLQTTTIYYDHWEDGYGFDPGNPGPTADETYILNQGDVQEFESPNVPVMPRGVAEFYDGRDRIYSAGGPITVTKAQWPDVTGSLFAVAWEIIPTKPMLANYTLPVGVDLAGAPYNYGDFTHVYAIVQATEDSTNVQIDDPATGGVEINVTINKGETTELYDVSKGTTITADKPVQAQIVEGMNSTYKADGLSLLPDSLWSNSYYSPATSGTAAAGKVDLYVYNPSGATITVNYEDSNGIGNFTVDANDTKSYFDGAGRYVPVGSGVHLNSTNNFWAVGSSGTESSTWDWGFSLIPSNLLTDEYFLGWAPGSSEATPTVNGSPAYVTPVANDTTVFVDYSPTDGIADTSYTLDRLDVQKIFDPDFENTGMHIWATGNIAVVWGEDPDTAAAGAPYLDVGYTTLPIPDEWTDIVLGTNKSASPGSLAFTAGQTASFTITTTTENYAVDDVDVFDTLPAGWNYVDDSSVITRPDNTTISGNAADPGIAGQDLTWNLDQDMATNETLQIVFSAVTTGSAASGYNQNNTYSSGTRFLGGQTFSPIANAFVFLAPVTIDVDTTTPNIVAGGVTTYVIKVTNYGLADQTNVTINDILPAGFTYASHSISEVNSTRTTTNNPTVGDNNVTFGEWTIGSLGSLTITLNANVGAGVSLGTYDNSVTVTTTEIGTIDDEGLVAADKDTPGNEDPENDEDVVLGISATASPSSPGVPDTGLDIKSNFKPFIAIIAGLSLMIHLVLGKKYLHRELPTK
jgi:uncharacterized repeat protein (TIGR01451 family)